MHKVYMDNGIEYDIKMRGTKEFVNKLKNM